VNNWYLRQGELTCELLEGWWTDAGTITSLHRAGNLVAETGANRTDGPTTRVPVGETTAPRRQRLRSARGRG
jgi:dTDP-glucose pyrophosphorylase